MANDHIKRRMLPDPLLFVATECEICTANSPLFFVQRQLPVRLALDAQVSTLPIASEDALFSIFFCRYSVNEKSTVESINSIPSFIYYRRQRNPVHPIWATGIFNT